MSRRTGGIKKRGDRKWLITIYRGEDPKTGKRRYESKTVNGTKRDAERELAAMQTQHARGELPTRSALRLGEWCEWWLENVKAGRIRKLTLDDYRQNLERYVKPYPIWQMRLQQVKTENLQSYLRQVQSDPKRNVGPRTVRMIHSILSGALDSARKLGRIHANPARDVELPKQKGREMRALSPEEARRFLKAAEGDRFEAYFALALDTGARPGELLALKWDDLDQEAGTIAIRRTLPRLKKDEPLRFEDPKTEQSRRTLPINPATLRALATHRSKQAGERLKAGRGPIAPDDLVFTSEPRPKPRAGGVSTQGGGPADQRNITNRHFKAAIERAGIEGTVRLYDLRHTMATALLTAGVPINAVSARLGHASPSMTLDVYGHVLPETAPVVAAAIGAAFFEASGTEGAPS